MSGAVQSNPFERLLIALEPWLPHIVIVGGWAHQLYRLHPHAQPLDYPPLSTLDTDIALPERPPMEEEDIRSRLLAHGFSEEFFGEDHPPATHYHLVGDASGFYAEFLTPLLGGELDRAKARKATARIAGIASQRLRFIDLLLDHAWSVGFHSGGFRASIQIANPVSFIAQKVLIHKKRGRMDKAKDILYMHDTLEVFGARLPALEELWRTTVAPKLQPSSKRKILAARGLLFREVNDDIRRAAEISVERALSPEGIRIACHYGFDRVFNSG
jgi:Nucleotidyltransferase